MQVGFSLRGGFRAPSVLLSAACTLACLVPAGGSGTDGIGWGTIGSVPTRDTPAYFQVLRQDYKFRDQPDYVQYSIDILIDPCRDEVKSGGKGDKCCFEANSAGCQHHPLIEAGSDLQVAYFQNAHIPNCRGTPFELDPNCGTYLEVHRVGDPSVSYRVLADACIDAEHFPNGYRTTRLATHSLCLGPHEVWWVVRTRSGPYVQKKREFFVTNPSCDAPPGGIPATQTVFAGDIP